MPGFLQWALRPGVLIAVSLVLLGVAGLVMLPGRNRKGQPQALPVGPDEQEIAWLYPATNTTTWDRFARAVEQASERLQDSAPGVEAEQDSRRAPSATAVPEVALSWPEAPRGRPDLNVRAGLRGKRLLFRWYKLTSEWTPAAWIEALLARDPPPLAIIGGNSSNSALELASQLKEWAARLPETRRPLLLLTNATADRVAASESSGDEPRTARLTGIYPDRTFRFCFTNRQMATAVTRFIWSQPGLRPDSDPAYLVRWMDDSYSKDLRDGYTRVLDSRAAETLLQQWMWVGGCFGLGAPPGVLAGWSTSGFRHEAPVGLDVDSSVGPFAAPNPFEARVVRDNLAKVRPGPTAPRRPLLVITGQAQASRRLLRDLARSAPDAARRFVVAMGDAVPFNTIYRDRLVTWPVQDLPFALVFFCHRNPIDAEAGFPAEQAASEPRTRASGTEDLLVYRDIVEASCLAFCRDGTPAADAAELAQGLLAVRQVRGRLSLGPDGFPLFGGTQAPGQRRDGTGEHVVYLQPLWDDDRVLPHARIEVWARQNDLSWAACGKPLLVSYDESEVHDVDRFQPR